MRGMKVGLSLYNEDGALAYVEGDDEMDRIEVAVDRTRRNAKSLCKKAAKRLRVVADRFERLAECDSPFKCKTQDAVNRGKAPQ